MFDLYFLHKSVVKEPNDTTFIFFLFSDLDLALTKLAVALNLGFFFCDFDIFI